MPITVAPPSGLAQTRRLRPSVSFGLGSILGAVDPHLTPKPTSWHHLAIRGMLIRWMPHWCLGSRVAW
jgi:hypothetical protein